MSPTAEYQVVHHNKLFPQLEEVSSAWKCSRFVEAVIVEAVLVE